MMVQNKKICRHDCMQNIKDLHRVQVQRQTRRTKIFHYVRPDAEPDVEIFQYVESDPETDVEINLLSNSDIQNTCRPDLEKYQ